MQAMSDYERRVWDELTNLEVKRRNSLTGKAVKKVGDVGGRVRDRLESTSAGEAFFGTSDEVLAKATQGLYLAVFVPALRTVSVNARLKQARQAGLCAESLEELRTNDLKDVDKRHPRMRNTGALAAESVASALAITGAEVATTVSGGATAGVVIGAVSADAAATVALLGRSVADVAVHYGFDPKLPEEERYVLAILNFGTASTQAGKVAALAALSNLTNQMMRKAAWKQLERDVLVRVIQRVFQQLGLRLTQRKLAQVVPFAGAAINLGLAVQLMETAVKSALHVYRLRFLTEKYGLDPNEWSATFEGEGESDEESETIIDVEVLDEDSSGVVEGDTSMPSST